MAQEDSAVVEGEAGRDVRGSTHYFAAHTVGRGEGGRNRREGRIGGGREGKIEGRIGEKEGRIGGKGRDRGEGRGGGERKEFLSVISHPLYSLTLPTRTLKPCTFRAALLKKKTRIKWKTPNIQHVAFTQPFAVARWSA